jgi:methylated-DNA-[protein]-cysteine S-methyltransferase
MLKKMIVESPIGALTLAGSASVLAALHLPGSDEPPPDAEPGKTALLERVAAQLREYFAGERRTFDVALAPAGTPFQHRVWDALMGIPFGELRSYGDIARVIGRPSASRAVGAANGRNPIAIIVPCHRVIGASGNLTGYGGGLPTKQWLLEHERRFAVKGQQRLFA